MKDKIQVIAAVYGLPCLRAQLCALAQNYASCGQSVDHSAHTLIRVAMLQVARDMRDRQEEKLLKTRLAQLRERKRQLNVDIEAVTAQEEELQSVCCCCRAFMRTSRGSQWQRCLRTAFCNTARYRWPL